MRKFLAALFILTGTVTAASAQRLDFGIFGGTTNYMGDLVEHSVYLPHTLPGGGGFIRYNAGKHFGIRLGGDFGMIQGDDVHSSDPDRNIRNLSFKSNIVDAHLLFEWNIYDIVVGRKKYVVPFAFAGISVFHFNPKAQWRDQWYELQPLSTEGQGLKEYPARQPYDLTQVSYPFGFGVKYIPNETWTFSIETRLHYTSTDYLDDVSGRYADVRFVRQHKGDVAAELADRGAFMRGRYTESNVRRGNDALNDWFFFSGFTVRWSPRRFTCDRF